MIYRVRALLYPYMQRRNQGRSKRVKPRNWRISYLHPIERRGTPWRGNTGLLYFVRLGPFNLTIRRKIKRRNQNVE